MSFSTSSVTSVSAPIAYVGGLKLAWAGALPANSAWQVYVGDTLSWHGTSNYCHIPIPTETQQITIGSVDIADATTSFASSLPPLPKRRVTLAWQGGRFEDPTDGDVQGFHVYGETTPGGGIDYATVLADIPVSIGGILTDGFGLGGFGSGGFGYGAGSYSWESGVLGSGTWNFAVVPYDSAGNEGTAATVAQSVVAPPTPPAPFPDGTRLHYSLLGFGQVPFGTGGYGEPEIVLTWNPSTA